MNDSSTSARGHSLAELTPPARRATRTKTIAGGLAIGFALLTGSAARAADPVSSVNTYTADPGAVLGGKLISWQGEVLANRNLNGFTAFSQAGVASPSPINAGAPVKTMALFNGLLAWIDSTNTVKTSNPGGTVSTLGVVNATATGLLGVGNQLWVARSGGIDRYAPAGVLGGASAVTLSAGAAVEMAVAPDGNVWVVEKVSGVDMLTRWSPLGAAVGATFKFSGRSERDRSGPRWCDVGRPRWHQLDRPVRPQRCLRRIRSSRWSGSCRHRRRH
jgi:hypothetical protein